MKHLSITEKQWNNLLEMSAKLFPEYKIIEKAYTLWFSDYYLMFDKCTLTECVHWFEFCMINLPERMFGNPKNNFQGLLGREYWSEKVALSFSKMHPIDWLYEQYNSTLN